MATETKVTATSAQKPTFMTMTAMVVGSMVGAGVFSLPRRFAQETGVAGALMAERGNLPARLESLLGEQVEARIEDVHDQSAPWLQVTPNAA